MTTEESTGTTADYKVRKSRIGPSLPGRVAVISISALALVAIVVAALVTRHGTPAAPSSSMIEGSVQKVVAKYNSGDWVGLKALTCGDTAARLLTGSHGGLLTNSAGNEVKVEKFSDFHFTTDYGNTGYTFSRTRLSVNGDPRGNSDDEVSFFALIKDHDVWKVCTAQLVSVYGAPS